MPPRPKHSPPASLPTSPPAQRPLHLLFYYSRKVCVQEATKVLAHVFYNLACNVSPCVVFKPGADFRPSEETAGVVALCNAFSENLKTSAPQPVQPLVSRGCHRCLRPRCPHLQPRHLHRDMTATRTICTVNANKFEEGVRGNRQRADRDENSRKKKEKAPHFFCRVRLFPKRSS